MLYCFILCCTALHYAVLYHTMLYCTILCCTAPYYAALHYTMLYCTILCCTAPYYITMCQIMLQYSFTWSHNISYRSTSYHITSHYTALHHITSHTTCHIVTYRSTGSTALPSQGRCPFLWPVWTAAGGLNVPKEYCWLCLLLLYVDNIYYCYLIL